MYREGCEGVMITYDLTADRVAPDPRPDACDLKGAHVHPCLPSHALDTQATTWFYSNGTALVTTMVVSHL